MTDDINRGMDPIVPIDPMVTGEVFRVKPVARDSDRRPDEQFNRQLKKKQKEGEDESKSGKNSRPHPGPGDQGGAGSAIRDEIILSGALGAIKSDEVPPGSDDAEGGRKRSEDDSDSGAGDGHIDVIA